MMENNPKAGGEEASENKPAPPVAAAPGDPSEGGTALAGNDEIRRYAARQLMQHLQVGADLALRCELLSQKAKADKLGPLNAAARLAHANARVAEALANFAEIERRHRSIIERIQPPAPDLAELNSRLQNGGVGERGALEFWKRIEAYVDEAVCARMADADAEDSLRQLIRDMEEKIGDAEARHREEMPDA